MRPQSKIALASLLLLSGHGSARAFPNYAVLFKSTFTYLPSCLACHEQDSWDNNDFGKQFGDAGRDLKAFAAIPNKDADGDGFSNYAEILAKSNPGDPHSTPKRPGDWLKEAGVHAPKKLLQSAFAGSSRFEVREYPLDEKQVKALSDRWGGALPDESRFSVLFQAYKDTELAGTGTYLSVDLPGFDGPTLLFIGSDKPGTLSFLKLIEYDGTRSLQKEKAWAAIIGKNGEGILKDASIKGPPKEIEAFKKAVVRGLLVIESSRKGVAP